MFLKPQGYSILVDPLNPNPIEADTYTCGHCQRIVIVTARVAPEDMGGICGACKKLICPVCYHKRTVLLEACETWEAMFDRMEARAKFLKDAGIE